MSEDADIQWGSTQVFASKAKIFYSSFFSEGIEYMLHDNVQVYNDENEEPYIGKIIKLWEEKPSGMKKVLIRWFLRLRDLDPQKEGDPKELYLAFGKGKGVTNENDLEVICGKSKVLCTSKDVRNKQPSANELKNADFFFSKIYNVDLQHLSPVQRVVDKLGCEAVYNKEEWVTEISKNKEEHIQHSESLPSSKDEILSKQKVECTHDSKPIPKNLGRDMEQKVSQGSVLKRQQPLNVEEVAKKKLKTSASTNPPTMAGAVAREFQKKEKVTPSYEVVVKKKIKVDGQAVQSKTNLPAFTSPQIDVKLIKSSQPSEARKVDREEGQNKLDLPACAPLQIKAKSLNVENSLSFKKIPVSEITSPKVDDALERAVTNSKLFSRQLAGAVSREFHKEKVATSDEAIVRKHVKVDGDQVQSKTNSLACTPPQIEEKLKKSFQLAEAINVDGQEGQSKLDFAACATVQIKATSVNVENSSSFKKSQAKEIASPKVDDALEQAVTNSKVSRQLTEIKGLSKADQAAKEAIPASFPVADGLGQALTGSRNSRQLELDSLPKVDRSVANLASLNSSRSKEIISEVQRDPPKLADNSSGFVEAEKSTVKRSICNLEIKREAATMSKLTASVVNSSLKEKNDQEKINLIPLSEPDSSVKDSDAKEENSDVTINPKLDTGSDIEKQSVPTIDLVKEKRRIFKKLPWKENLQQGLSFGKVLLLQNLDPSLTSADVCDMLRNILQGVSDVRIIPQETVCPYGQALAVFDSRLLAENALQEMERKCLVLASNKRPIIATKFKETSSLTRFPGHLALDKLKLGRNLGADDYTKAVSTSHSSQPNTIEYEMAMEWRRLQEITQTCRVELFEKQKREIEEIRKSCNRKGF